MLDLYPQTIKFLNALLKAKQLEMANSGHWRKTKRLKAEFDGLRRRLSLEIVYAMNEEG